MRRLASRPARGTGRSMSDTQLSEPRSGPARPNAVHGLFECRDKLPADIARAAKIFGLALTSCQDVDRHNYCPEPPAAALCPVTCGTCQILEQRQTVHQATPTSCNASTEEITRMNAALVRASHHDWNHNKTSQQSASCMDGWCKVGQGTFKTVWESPSSPLVLKLATLSGATGETLRAELAQTPLHCPRHHCAQLFVRLTHCCKCPHRVSKDLGIECPRPPLCNERSTGCGGRLTRRKLGRCASRSTSRTRSCGSGSCSLSRKPLARGRRRLRAQNVKFDVKAELWRWWKGGWITLDFAASQVTVQ